MGEILCLCFSHPISTIEARLAMKIETDRSFPSELQSLVAAANARFSVSHAAERLRACDHRLWKQDPTDITNRLGWLTIIEHMKDRT